MVLDSEDQRNVLVGLINSASFVGKDAENVVSLRRAISQASVVEKKKLGPLNVVSEKKEK